MLAQLNNTDTRGYILLMIALHVYPQMNSITKRLKVVREANFNIRRRRFFSLIVFTILLINLY